MMPVLEDVEAMVVDFLRPVVGVKVGTKIPNPRPTEFVRVLRTGGSASNRVLETAQVTVTCEADSTVRASQLARLARTAFLNDYTGMPLVRGVSETGGPYFNPDPDTGRDRYTFTVALSVRAHN